jgi:acyl dehydratase
VNVADVTPITPQQAQAQLGVTFDDAPDAVSPARADDSALAVA